MKDYLQLCPHVDAVASWNTLFDRMTSRRLGARTPSFRGKGALQRLTRAVQGWRYRCDVALLPVRSPTSDMHDVMKGIVARKRYGISGDTTNQSEPCDTAADTVYTARLDVGSEHRWQHEIVTTKRFLEMLGVIVDDDLWPEVWLDSHDREWAATRVPARQGGVLTLGLCPGVTSHMRKFYSGERIRDALAAVNEQRFSVVVLGSPPEREMCRQVADAVVDCPNVDGVVNLAGSSTVRQMAATLDACDVVLAQETAALHLAVALNKPTVGIVGGGHWRRFYPWGTAARNRSAHLRMDCFGCNWQCIYETARCIQDLRPAALARELRVALSSSPGGSRVD